MIRGDEPWAWTKRPVSVADSGGGRGRRPGDLVPDREAVGHHRSLVGRRQQVPTGPKVRPDAAQRGQQPLRVPDRREAFHRPLALPGRLVRVLGAVVQVRRPATGHRRHQLAVRHRVAGQLKVQVDCSLTSRIAVSRLFVEPARPPCGYTIRSLRICRRTKVSPRARPRRSSRRVIS